MPVQSKGAGFATDGKNSKKLPVPMLTYPIVGVKYGAGSGSVLFDFSFFGLERSSCLCDLSDSSTVDWAFARSCFERPNPFK